ncbi:hypothetical protein ACFQHV_10465 [Promicromonospora thailandica]|uniref:Capsular polysaccharide biosynthesis protein n=1 Tax=Promicromonospora thailandica TaxID=765201 RepID=A0A9X2G3N8_9MICO|nr:hypothetical protein [Promicromonospora thailandica]MCP2264898.1 hypothetical protein [Promicromonospora thailandica]
MSFLDVIAAVGRQWIVAVVGVLATAALGWGATTMEPPVYTARALVLLVPSEQAVGVGGNPFLALGGLDLPARVVVAYYESDVAKARFTGGSADTEYVVAIEESTRGPVIAVDVTDATPGRALETLNLITSSVPDELRRLQEEVDAPPDTIVSTLVLAKDEQAETDMSGTVRMLIAAVGVGLVVTVVGAVAIDGVQRSRARGRRPVTGPPVVGPPSIEPQGAPKGGATPSGKPVVGKPPVGNPASGKPPTVRLPSVAPAWHNPAPDPRDRRRDDAAARASTAEPR